MNQSILDYEFAPTNGGLETGNDPTITFFKGDNNYFLARESIQNIIDAAIKYPAIASFKLFTKTSEQIPERNRLKSIFEACWRSVRGNTRMEKSYIDALENLKYGKEQIYILEISDFNTKGMTYKENDEKCDYHLFMKTVGSSFKSTSGGGSWGLGKGAYYASSTFKMIFISSIYDRDKYIFQGGLRLCSFKDPESGIMMQGNGSFGFIGQKPVTDSKLIPEMFKREKQGTSFYIIGFEKQDNWKKLFMKSILNNFWPALHKGILEVQVDGETINKENLNDQLHNLFSIEQADTDNNPNPLHYYYALTDEKHKIFEEDLPTLGKSRLYVLENDKFSNKVAYIRSTGMIIQKIKKPIFKKYAALFECDNEKGNSILQRMENPTHDKWSKYNDPNYLSEPPKDLIKAETEINKFIKNNLDKLTEFSESKSLRIIGLEEYLGIPSDEGYASGSPITIGEVGEVSPSDEEKGLEIGKSESITEQEKIKVKPVIFTSKIEEVKEGKGEEILIGEGSGGHNFKESEKTAGNGDEKRKIAVAISYRTFYVKTIDNKVKYIFILRGKADNKIDIEVRAATDDGAIPLNIKRVEDINGKPVDIDGQWIRGIDLQQKNEIKLNVFFEENDKFSLYLRAYANK